MQVIGGMCCSGLVLIAPDFCDIVAALACKLLNSIVPWEDISALVVNRLIALDKCPGVRPIGIGETL